MSEEERAIKRTLPEWHRDIIENIICKFSYPVIAKGKGNTFMEALENLRVFITSSFLTRALYEEVGDYLNGLQLLDRPYEHTPASINPARRVDYII